MRKSAAAGGARDGGWRRRAASVTAVTGMVVPVACFAIAAGAPSAQAKAPGPLGRIAFARNDGTGDTVTYTANPDGTDVRRLYPAASESPRWSPDGSQVAVTACADPPVCDTAAVVVNPDTGAARVLPMSDPGNVFTSCNIWSPDGRRLACEGDGQTDPSLNGIYTISSSDGGDLTRITANPGGDSPLDYSPDGRQIVINRTDPTRAGTRNQALFVVNVDGTGQRRITPWGFSDNQASWSPDGRAIAFEHSGKLFTVHPDGTGLALLPLAVPGRSFAGDASWSPDGSKILFLLGTANGTEGIATANRDGSGVTRVSTSPPSDFDHEGDWGSHSRS